jgi:hypothetical protein
VGRGGNLAQRVGHQPTASASGASVRGGAGASAAHPGASASHARVGGALGGGAGGADTRAAHAQESASVTEELREVRLGAVMTAGRETRCAPWRCRRRHRRAWT